MPRRPPPSPRRRRRVDRRLLLPVAACLLAVGCSRGSDGAAPEGETQPSSPAASPAPRGSGPGGGTRTVPDGWTQREVPGLLVALPPGWEDVPQEQRAAPQAALEVGVPFTGQPRFPPLLQVFVETQPVGDLETREDVFVAQLEAGLPDDAEISTSRPRDVAGADGAVELEVRYTSPGGTSVLDTPLEDTVALQRELLVDSPGEREFGLRYGAAEQDFDEALWDELVAALEVTDEGPPG